MPVSQDNSGEDGDPRAVTIGEASQLKHNRGLRLKAAREEGAPVAAIVGKPCIEEDSGGYLDPSLLQFPPPRLLFDAC